MSTKQLYGSHEQGAEYTAEEFVAGDKYVTLPLFHGDLGYNDATRALLKDIGGVDTIYEITYAFYQKFWADNYLKQFLGKLHYPLEVHARRFALYVAEMMGDETEPWTKDTSRATTCPFRSVSVPVAGGQRTTVQSRQGAHFAAWNSVTRPADMVGRRFKLDDCRVWMRLMFWAAREVKMPQRYPVFFSYFVRWIGHFIPIYESTALAFVRMESRWSLNPDNIENYIKNDRVMTDVLSLKFQTAAAQLPPSERDDDSWPYQGAAKSGSHSKRNGRMGF